VDIGRPCRSCAVAEEVTIMGWIPDVKNWREAVFTGHFGPMGIGAIFISTRRRAQATNNIKSRWLWIWFNLSSHS